MEFTRKYDEILIINLDQDQKKAGTKNQILLIVGVNDLYEGRELVLNVFKSGIFQ